MESLVGQNFPKFFFPRSLVYVDSQLGNLSVYKSCTSSLVFRWSCFGKILSKVNACIFKKEYYVATLFITHIITFEIKQHTLQGGLRENIVRMKGSEQAGL